jgi:hypothetical protein
LPYPVGSCSDERKFLTAVIENWNTVESSQCEAKMSTFSLEQSRIYGNDVNFMRAKDEGRKLPKIMNLLSVHKLTAGSCVTFRFLSCYRPRSYTETKEDDSILLVTFAF